QRNTLISRSAMLCTSTVRPSREKAIASFHGPIGAASRRRSVLPSTANIVSRPLSLWNGWLGGLVVPFSAPTARYLPSGENFSGSGPLGTPTVSTTRNGFVVRSIRLTESSSPSPRPMFDTAASVPAALMSIVYGAMPVVSGRGSTVTFVPSMCSTLTMLSPPRDSSAVLPSCVKTMPLGSEPLLPRSSLPTGVSRLSATLNTDTVPSVRFAISASAPSGETRTVVAPRPEVRLCTILGGLTARSITLTRSSGPVPPLPWGSDLVADVTMAQLWSLATHAAVGGPTTLPGTSIVALMTGG